jgi:hypothetical protein
MSRKKPGKATGVLAGAMQAIAEAITPKPIKAGDKLIIPSADPSMPPMIVPARKRARRKPVTSAGRTTKARKAGSNKAARARKNSRPSARKAKHATKSARR